jgi:hypothetical protein
MGDGSAWEGIQKVHPVANLLVGFSGGVRAGFALVDELRAKIARHGGCDLRVTCEAHNQWLRRLLSRWWRQMDLSDWERDKGVSALLAGVDPHLRPMGSGWWMAWASAYKISSPAFVPVPILPSKAAMIGSGAVAYRAQMDQFLTELPTKRSVTGHPSGLAVQLGMMMSSHAEWAPERTVSSHMFAGVATFRSAVVGPIALATPQAEIPFPRTASTYEEFVRMTRADGRDGACATT